MKRGNDDGQADGGQDALGASWTAEVERGGGTLRDRGVGGERRVGDDVRAAGWALSSTGVLVEGAPRSRRGCGEAGSGGVVDLDLRAGDRACCGGGGASGHAG